MSESNQQGTFQLVSSYKPTGDQPQAIAKLVEGIQRGDREQTLLGVTGSGKTFTMANVIAQVQKPTLVLAHNKTLAAQLCSEFREFFPHNAVEYFVSYYDYYQPEAYIATTDTYIEKDSAINDEIDKLRHSATSALSERRDVIIVASVSCIYSLGDPIDYRNMVISLRPGMTKKRDELLAKLEKNGYITREPSQEDRRVMLVHLTEKGRTEEQPESASDTLFSCLSPEEQASFGSYLDRIIAALEAELGAASPAYRENCRRRNEAFARCFNGQSPMGGGRGQHGRCFRDGAGRGRHRHNEGPCR